MLSVAEAEARVLNLVRPLTGIDVLALAQAHGRVLADDVRAQVSHPPADVSAMDGYAVRASAHRVWRVVGTAAAGSGFPGQVGDGEAVRIFTGAPLPSGADSVIIQENVAREGDVIQLSSDNALVAGRHIRRAGHDFVRGDVLLRAGERLTARDIALAAAMNHATLPCRPRPRVALLATGDELVSPGAAPGPAQIVSSSPAGLGAEIAAWGGVAQDLGIARDDVGDIRARLAAADRPDLLVTIGGASVGDFDLIQTALGADLSLDFWKIAMRPGKPLICGTYRGVPLLGLPGNPVSAFVCALLFIKPALHRFTGATAAPHRFVPAELAVPVGANDTRQDYARCTLEDLPGGRLRAMPLKVQDSGMLRYLAVADGLIVRPPHDPALPAGAMVEVLRLD